MEFSEAYNMDGKLFVPYSEAKQQIEEYKKAFKMACEELAHIACNPSSIPCVPEAECKDCWFDYLMQKARKEE